VRVAMGGHDAGSDAIREAHDHLAILCDDLFAVRCEMAEEFGEAGTRGLFLVVEIERDRWRNGTAGRRLTPCSRVICIRLGITPTLANPADQRRPL
jgi:hypothetical protein